MQRRRIFALKRKSDGCLWWIVKKGISCLLILLGVTFVTFTFDVSGRRRCHFLSLTERFCDALLIMHQGVCVEQGAMEEILRYPKDLYTRRLLEAAGVG